MTDNCKCRQLESLVRDLEIKGIQKREIREFAESTGLDLCSYRHDAKLAAYFHGVLSGFLGFGAGVVSFNILKQFETPDAINSILATTIGVAGCFSLHYFVYSKKKCEQNGKFYEMVKEKFKM